MSAQFYPHDIRQIGNSNGSVIIPLRKDIYEIIDVTNGGRGVKMFIGDEVVDQVNEFLDETIYRVQPVGVSVSELTVLRNEVVYFNRIKNQINERALLEQNGTLTYNGKVNTSSIWRQTVNVVYEMNGQSIDIPVVVNVVDYATKYSPSATNVTVDYNYAISNTDA